MLEPVFEFNEALQKRRILVVDDSAASRGILQGLLLSLGYQPVLAESAEAGLEELVCAGQTHPYDLVFMDWQMPEGDGFEAAARIRSHPDSQAAQPQIIILTPYGSEDIQQRVTQHGLDAYLTKPVSIFSFLRPFRAVVAEKASRLLARSVMIRRDRIRSWRDQGAKGSSGRG